MYSIFDRLKEPSSWAGLAAFLGVLMIGGWTAADWNGIFSVIAGAFGVMAMFMADKPAE